MNAQATKGLMHGRRGLIMGVANSHSIAWGIAQTLAAHGAELCFTYQGDALGKRGLANLRYPGETLPGDASERSVGKADPRSRGSPVCPVPLPRR